jgi:hypothetical protein
MTPDDENDCHLKDFVALAKETGHPSELLMELHRAIEINTA